MPDSDEPYGVTYPTDLLSSLPILDSDSTKQHPHPIRALPASTFSNLHLTHLLTHPPDHVLFPFIHGLEGTNVAQNQFFATNSNQQQQHFANPSPLHPHHASALPSLPPKYRGLVWVVCDEDLDQTDMSITSRGHVSPSTPSTESDSDSDEEDDDDDDIDMDTDMCYSDTNDNDDPMMQIDSGSVRIQTAGDGPEEGGIHVEDRPAKGLGADGEEKHMHPVQHRSTTIPIHDMPSPSTQTFEDSSASESFPFVHETNLTIQQQEQARAYRSKSPSPSPDPSPAAASTSLTTASPPTSSTSLPATSPTTTPTTTPTAGSSPAVASSSSSQPQLQTTANRPVHRDPPLLTSTFRPADLIRRVQPSTPAVSFFLGTGPAILRSADTKEVGEENDDDDDQYEFVPLKVPDGISLRNFGIQVPIFATISDIIVYSPKGPTENAIRLARRFRGAIERKRRERAARSGLNDKEGEEKESGLLRYNVFVLDAGEEEMRDKLEYLMIRTGKGIDGMETDVEDESDTDKAIANEDPDATKDMDVDRLPRRHSGSHTDGTDGHTNQEVFGGTQPIPLQSERKEKQKRRQRPNTVNFAEREKEEMRDLTKASEIISVFPSPVPHHGSPLHHRANSDTIPPNPAVGLDLSTTRTHWDPMLGQVFLGNSDDVPLGSDFEGEKERERERARQRQQTKNHPATPSTTSTNLISTEKLSATDPFNYASNDPTLGYGYDICLECHDMAPFPGPAHLKAAEEHLAMLDALWAERCSEDAGGQQQQQQRELPPRPPPNANAVIHLPFPSSPPCNLATMTALMPVIKFLEKWLQPPVVSPSPPAPTPALASSSSSSSADTGAGAGSDTNSSNSNTANSQSSARRWSSVTSLIPSFAPFPQLAGGSSSLTRNRAFTSPNPTNPPTQSPPSPTRTRPLKILIYSSDGYTESSVPALCLLMAVKTLTLPEAYLELQVVKKRSFFVYMSDLGVLRRVEGRLVLEREQERDRKGAGVGAGAGVVGGGSGGVKRGAVGGHGGRRPSFSGSGLGLGSGIGVGMGIGVNQNPYTVNQIVTSTPSPPTPPLPSHHPITDSPGPRHSHSSHSLVGAGGRPSAKSVSFAQPPPTVSVSSPPPLPSVSAVPAMMVPAQQQQQRRPRASTSPWLPSFSLFGDHQSWFNDPRFDGSFPSRVLPFLYLGNLNHASNAYMLHALGITHVVSVGECALVPPPPPHGSASSTSSSNAGFMSSSPASCHRPSSGAHFVPGKGPDGQGSLWIEEREGRIKVLDIKGVCDDGIDTLEPQLEPICEWIDKARAEGGQVLVHCRVGVSRSATVVIAYVMKHLSIPLVDAYLIVRSRRLSVLIQPNMRLLYNLCGWEVKLAKDRAGGDEDRLKDELSRTLSWPYLAKEVHTLNEKYLHN